MKNPNSILDVLHKHSDFLAEMQRLGMVLGMHSKDIDFLSARILEISKDAPITESQLVQVVTEGAAIDVPVDELACFTRIFINVMFVLNENIPLLGHWMSLLIDAFSAIRRFDQDVIDGAESVLRSIVYLTNLANGKIIFVK